MQSVLFCALLLTASAQNWNVNFNNGQCGGSGCSGGSGSDLEDITNIFRQWNGQTPDSAPSKPVVTPQPGNEATTTFTDDATCLVGGPHNTIFATPSEGIPCVEWYSANWACGRRRFVSTRNHHNTACRATPTGYSCSANFEITYFFNQNTDSATNQASFPLMTIVNFNHNKEMTWEGFFISDRSIETGDSIATHCNCVESGGFPADEASPCPGPANNSG